MNLFSCETQKKIKEELTKEELIQKIKESKKGGLKMVEKVITLDWNTCKLYINKAKIKVLENEVEFLRKFTCGDVYLNDVEERYQAQKKRLEKIKKGGLIMVTSVKLVLLKKDNFLEQIEINITDSVSKKLDGHLADWKIGAIKYHYKAKKKVV